MGIGGVVINDDHERVFGVTKGQTAIVVTAGAYSANDIVGGKLVFAVGAGGIVADILLTDAANQSEAYTLHIFDAEPTAIVDNIAYGTTLVIADQMNKIAEISLAAGRYTTDNSLAWARVPNVDLKFHAPNGNLYVYAECLSGPTQGATDDIQISMLIQKN